jgi:type VI secretion system protein ImpK
MPEQARIENSLILMQFRQFCGELLHLRDRLEQASAVLAVAPREKPVVKLATPLDPVEIAQAASAEALARTREAVEQAIAAATRKAEAGTEAASPLVATLPPVKTETRTRPNVDHEAMAVEREEVRARLLQLLEQQTYQAMNLGGSFALGTLREAQYVMAVLADEVLLNAKWSGKGGWRLLEESMFHTHASGEVFFSKLDALLRLGDGGSAELAMVYFQALVLDFQGKYRNHDPARHLQRYRRQLFMRLYQSAPESLPAEPICPQANDFSQAPETFSRLPNPNRWWAALGGVVLLWLLLSSVIWPMAVAGLGTQLDRIETVARGGGRTPAP